MQESVSRSIIFTWNSSSSVETSFIVIGTKVTKARKNVLERSWTIRPGGFILPRCICTNWGGMGGRGEGGAWPPIRGTDLSCHLIALLLRTPPSSRDDDVQHHHLRRSCTRRDPNFFDTTRCAMSSTLVLFNSAFWHHFDVICIRCIVYSTRINSTVTRLPTYFENLQVW